MARIRKSCFVWIYKVDVNVGRIVVRLGWVPLEPMPDYVAMHKLEK